MGTLKEELEIWKASRYQKPMSIALAEVRERHNCSKVHPGKRHQEWMKPEVKEELESFDEGRMKDIYTMDQDGKSKEEIAKRLGLKVSTVKSILGEEVLSEFSDAQIDSLKRDYAGLQGKTISGINANKLMKIFDKFDKSKPLLIKLLKAKIPFVSMLAQARLISKHGANAAQLAQMRREELEEAKYTYSFTITSDYGNDGGDQEEEGTLNASSDKDAENKAEKLADKFCEKINKQKSSVGRPGHFEPKEVDVYKEQLEEKFQDGFAVRYLDPLNKKRFVVPLKTKKEADDKAAQLKRDGCKDITITKHNLNFKEDSDYLKSKMNDKQISNIKNVWKNKKASDVDQGVKDMIKKMDIPTQLAIKHADIPHLSKLVEIATHGSGPRLTFERLWRQHKRGDK